MSETDNKEVVTKVDETQQVESNPEMERATLQGWKPKEQYTGDPDKWVDYEEFNRRAPFFEALSKANKRVKFMEEQIAALTEHHKKTAETAYKQAYDALLKEKKEAAKAHDIERVVELDEQIDDLKKATPTATVPENKPSKELEEFARDNKWYLEDEDLQNYANGYGAKLEKLYPSMPTNELLEKVVQKVKDTFPHKFNKPVQTTSVASSRPSPSGISVTKKKGISYNDLPDEAKMIYNRLVKSTRNPHGIMTSEQYLKEYAANSGLTSEE